MIEYIKALLEDKKHSGGAPSSKRHITAAAFVSLEVAFFANIFFGVVVEEFLFNGMLYLVGGGLGFVTLEKFSSGSKGQQQQLNNIQRNPDVTNTLPPDDVEIV